MLYEVMPYTFVFASYTEVSARSAALWLCATDNLSLPLDCILFAKLFYFAMPLRRPSGTVPS